MVTKADFDALFKKQGIDTRILGIDPKDLDAQIQYDPSTAQKLYDNISKVNPADYGGSSDDIAQAYLDAASSARPNPDGYSNTAQSSDSSSSSSSSAPIDINTARTSARQFGDGTTYALDFEQGGKSYTFVPSNVVKNGGVTAGDNTYLLPWLANSDNQASFGKTATSFDLSGNDNLAKYLQGQGQSTTGYLIPSDQVSFDSNIQTMPTSNLGGSLSGLKQVGDQVTYGLSGGGGSRHMTPSGEVHNPTTTYSSILGDVFGGVGQDVADFVNSDIGKAALIAGGAYAGGAFDPTSLGGGESLSGIDLGGPGGSPASWLGSGASNAGTASGIASLGASVNAPADAFGAGAGNVATDAATAAGAPAGGITDLTGNVASGAGATGLASLPSSVNSAADAFGVGGGSTAVDAATAAGAGASGTALADPALAASTGAGITSLGGPSGASAIEGVGGATAADNIDVGGGYNPATGAGDAATAAGAAETGVTSSAAVPYGATGAGLLSQISAATGIPEALLTAGAGALGLNLAGKLLSPSNPAPTTGGVSQTPVGGALSSSYKPYRYQSYAGGGIASLGGYSDGGQLLRGPGNGTSDSIPAIIGDKQPARLADGEFVVPARIVSELGNGSTDAGARQLYKMMDRIQSRRNKTTGKGRFSVDTKAQKDLPA